MNFTLYDYKRTTMSKRAREDIKMNEFDKADITTRQHDTDIPLTLSDGNIIYVDIRMLRSFSNYIVELFDTYKTEEERKDIIFKGDVETYKFIHYSCLQHMNGHHCCYYLDKYGDKLNGSTIIVTMEYLQMDRDFIKNEIIPNLLSMLTLEWNDTLPKYYVKLIIKNTVSIRRFNYLDSPDWEGYQRIHHSSELKINQRTYKIISQTNAHALMAKYIAHLYSLKECDGTDEFNE